MALRSLIFSDPRSNSCDRKIISTLNVLSYIALDEGPNESTMLLYLTQVEKFVPLVSHVPQNQAHRRRVCQEYVLLQG